MGFGMKRTSGQPDGYQRGWRSIRTYLILNYNGAWLTWVNAVIGGGYVGCYWLLEVRATELGLWSGTRGRQPDEVRAAVWSANGTDRLLRKSLRPRRAGSSPVPLAPAAIGRVDKAATWTRKRKGPTSDRGASGVVTTPSVQARVSLEQAKVP
jgi:hypothetical protein